MDQATCVFTLLGVVLNPNRRRLLGTFLADVVDVPTEAIDYVAVQLHINDPSCLKAYAIVTPPAVTEVAWSMPLWVAVRSRSARGMP